MLSLLRDANETKKAGSAKKNDSKMTIGACIYAPVNLHCSSIRGSGVRKPLFLLTKFCFCFARFDS